MIYRARPTLSLALVASLAVVSASAQAQSLTKNGNPMPATIAPPHDEVLGPATITQSTSQTVTTGNSVSCNTGAGGGFEHTNQSYFRAFTLSAFNPPLDQLQFAVQSITFGIETANDGAGVGQPVTVNIYNASANPPTNATLGPVLGTVALTIPDQANTLFTATFPAPVVFTVATGILVVEIFTPDGQVANHSFFIGSNALGQCCASFIRAPTGASCNINEITNIAAINFAGMHIVMNVNGNSQMPVGLESISID